MKFFSLLEPDLSGFINNLKLSLRVSDGSAWYLLFWWRLCGCGGCWDCSVTNVWWSGWGRYWSTRRNILTETKHSSGCPTISSGSSQTFRQLNIFWFHSFQKHIYKIDKYRQQLNWTNVLYEWKWSILFESYNNRSVYKGLIKAHLRIVIQILTCQQN